jgi:hypothetical protein
VKVSRLRQVLERLTDVREVKGIRDKAETLRVYAKQAGYGRDTQNAVAEIKLRAERKAGEIISKMPKHPGAATRSRDVKALPPTLKELGIKRMQSSRWQTEAGVPDSKFEEYLAEIKARPQGEVTSSGLVIFARRLKAPHTEKKPKPQMQTKSSWLQELLKQVEQEIADELHDMIQHKAPTSLIEGFDTGSKEVFKLIRKRVRK